MLTMQLMWNLMVRYMSEGCELSLSDLPARLQQEYAIAPSDIPAANTPLPPTGRVSQESALQECERDASGRDMPDQALDQGLSLKDAVATFERSFLEKAMQRYSSIQAVSEAVDVHFSTLWRKLVKYGLVQNHSAEEKNHG